jgi:hypothetical protein
MDGVGEVRGKGRGTGDRARRSDADF